AVTLLRRVLAGQADGSVVIVQVGFSTNLASLLKSPPDDVCPISGRELVAKKVRLLSVMAGAFAPINGQPHFEYNVVEDIPSAKILAAEWPSQIVYSGFEIGLAVPYPSTSIEQDYNYVPHHPLKESYVLYEPPPHNRPTWDLTSVLYAVFPDRGYFGLSMPGTVTVDDKGLTTFTAADSGLRRFLTLTPDQQVRVTEALVQLSSEPPHR
ncbi:MAG: nucleoside hydrolase, partial [Planctomycetota bacterium]